MTDDDAPAGPGGRPSKYDPGRLDDVRKLAQMGHTDMEIADFLEIDRATLYRWKSLHPGFCDALSEGKEAADNRVKRALYEKATGYSFDAVKIMQNDGVPVIVPYREHVPPSDTAMIFWLKNRDPANWRDRSQLEHSGPEGTPIPVQFYIPSNGRDDALPVEEHET